jgi:hypothetical protein
VGSLMGILTFEIIVFSRRNNPLQKTLTAVNF